MWRFLCHRGGPQNIPTDGKQKFKVPKVRCQRVRCLTETSSPLRVQPELSSPLKWVNAASKAPLREASAAQAAYLCAGHAQQLGGESPLANLMEVKD
jgi:hypothetical protein